MSHNLIPTKRYMRRINKLGKRAKLERQLNFAYKPEHCDHLLVYHKDGDNVHCHYCDKFMYREDHV